MWCSLSGEENSTKTNRMRLSVVMNQNRRKRYRRRSTREVFSKTKLWSSAYSAASNKTILAFSSAAPKIVSNSSAGSDWKHWSVKTFEEKPPFKHKILPRICQWPTHGRHQRLGWCLSEVYTVLCSSELETLLDPSPIARQRTYSCKTAMKKMF